MSWVVVGDSDYAVFACDTGMKAFGPLHSAFSAGRNAEKELREFGQQLPQDPRKYDEQELVDTYHDWKKEQEWWG